MVGPRGLEPRTNGFSYPTVSGRTGLSHHPRRVPGARGGTPLVSEPSPQRGSAADCRRPLALRFPAIHPVHTDGFRRRGSTCCQESTALPIELEARSSRGVASLVGSCDDNRRPARLHSRSRQCSPSGNSNARLRALGKRAHDTSGCRADVRQARHSQDVGPGLLGDVGFHHRDDLANRFDADADQSFGGAIQVYHQDVDIGKQGDHPEHSQPDQFARDPR